MGTTRDHNTRPTMLSTVSELYRVVTPKLVRAMLCETDESKGRGRDEREESKRERRGKGRRSWGVKITPTCYEAPTLYAKRALREEVDESFSSGA